MRTLLTRAAAAALALAATTIAAAPGALPAQVLTFEGVGNDAQVGSFYAGLGITFSDNAFAFTRTNLGGSGQFGGEPSPGTAVVFSGFPPDPASGLPGDPAFIDVAGGFTDGLGLFVSAPVPPGVPAPPLVVRIWSGLGGTGNLLAEFGLPTVAPALAQCPNNPGALYCPFVPTAVAFQGVARSIDFGGALNGAMFDNITLGRAGLAVVPEPGTVALVAAGLLALPVLARRRRRA